MYSRCIGPVTPLRAAGPHTRRIFSGIRFGSWNTPTPKLKLYHQATAASG
ncbi:hypothetical protein AVEN_24985-1, partial [Araneus ventricosus]